MERTLELPILCLELAPRSQRKFAEFSMQPCDARPSYVQAHLDEWLKNVKLFLPVGLLRENGA
jgi:hypothetical protein